MEISFERATATDAQALLNAQIRAFHHDSRLYPGIELGGPPGYESIDTLLADLDHDDCYKIIADGQIIGGIVVFDRGSGHFHLDRIYLDPDYHNLGVGTQAMH